VRYPAHRWIYNKLAVAESQGLRCAPHGVEPPDYPVFSKPIVNLRGMGVGSCVLHERADYLSRQAAGHFWMPLLRGEHLSSDLAVVDGRIAWIRHALGKPLDAGTFDYWMIDPQPRPAFESYCGDWVQANLRGYTGMLNVESIGHRVIEAHLRFTDQWPDLYGEGWLAAVVRLYSEGLWDHADRDPRPGYSVVLFGSHGPAWRHPDPQLVGELESAPDICSVQITFDEHRPAERHSMPPGGFRLAIVNCRELNAGQTARRRLARAFSVATPGPTQFVHGD
jgi:hypothetical protein